MNEKKIWKSLLGEKYLLVIPVDFSVKNIANNADTFSNSFSTCIEQQIQFVMVWVETAQIHRYRQQHISPGRILHNRIILEHW